MAHHPKRYRPYWVHPVWTLFLFLYLIHFWWWEFALHKVVTWTFPLYFFVALYAVLMYLQCALMYPIDLSDYRGFADYFHTRKSWIFGVMALLFTADIGDTLLKGVPYLKTLGPVYYVRTIAYLSLSLVAIKIDNRVFRRGLIEDRVLNSAGHLRTMRVRDQSRNLIAFGNEAQRALTHSVTYPAADLDASESAGESYFAA